MKAGKIVRRAAVAAALALGVAAPMASATPLGLGSWQTFSFDLAPSAAATYEVHVDADTHVKIRLVDCCIIGDEFSYSVDGGPAHATSATAPGDDGVQSGAFDGDAAWADPRLSHSIFVLLAGDHTIDVSLTRNALGTSSGSAFIRADIPEPATLGVFGLALAGLGFSRRKRA